MKVLIINGSPRINGATATVLHMMESNLKENDIDVDFFNLSEIEMSHCIGCCSCYKTGHCCIDDDAEKISKMIEEADGIVMGSPTYASNVSGIMKDFIDRGHFVIEQLLHKKYCVTVATGENYGNKSAMKVLKNLVLLSGGRLSGLLLIRIPFNDVQSIKNKLDGKINNVSLRLASGMRHKKLYPLQRMFHFVAFRFGITPFVKKKGNQYLGVTERWRKLGIY